MRFEKIVTSTVTELFESTMQRHIISGELAVGEHLPPERVLAEEMGISKSAVHSGLKNLERAGFICIDARRGSYVANWHENGNLETLTALLNSNVLKLDRRNIHSLILLRETAESEAMKQFAANHSNTDILLLRTLAHELRESTRSTIPMTLTQKAELAYRFSHYIIFQSGNMFTSLIFNSFKPFSLKLWEEWIRLIGEEEAAAYLEKTAIALREGNGDLAIQILHKNNEELMAAIRASEEIR